LSGGFGFVWLLNDFWGSGKGFFDFLWNLPGDYTISDKFRWGNPLVVLFITQRSFLIGMPLTIIVLQKLWEIFTDSRKKTKRKQKQTITREKTPTFKTVNRSLPTAFGSALFASACSPECCR
jgi:hypothetical protein